MNKLRFFFIFLICLTCSIGASSYFSESSEYEGSKIFSKNTCDYNEAINSHINLAICLKRDGFGVEEIQELMNHLYDGGGYNALEDYYIKNYVKEPYTEESFEDPDYNLMQDDEIKKESKYLGFFDSLKTILYPFSCCFCPLPDELNLRKRYKQYENFSSASFSEEESFNEIPSRVVKILGRLPIEIFENDGDYLECCYLGLNLNRNFSYRFQLKDFTLLEVDDLEDKCRQFWNSDQHYDFDKRPVDAFFIVVSAMLQNYKVGECTLLMTLLALNDISFSTFLTSYVDNNTLKKINTKINNKSFKVAGLINILYKNLKGNNDIDFEKKDIKAIKKLQAYQLSLLWRHELFRKLTKKLIKKNISVIDDWSTCFKVEWLSYFKNKKTASYVWPIVQQIEESIPQKLSSIDDVMQAVIYFFKYKEEDVDFEFLKNINDRFSIDSSEDSYVFGVDDFGDITFEDADIEDLNNLFEICSFFFKNGALEVIKVLRKIILDTEGRSLKYRSTELLNELGLKIDNLSCVTNVFLSSCLFCYVEYCNNFITKEVNQHRVSMSCHPAMIIPGPLPWDYKEKFSASKSNREALGDLLFIQKKILTLASFFYNKSNSSNDFCSWLGPAILGELDYFKGLSRQSYKNFEYLFDCYDYYNNVENISSQDVKRCSSLQREYNKYRKYNFRLDGLFEVFVYGPKVQPCRDFCSAIFAVRNCMKKENNEEFLHFQLIEEMLQEWFSNREII